MNVKPYGEYAEKWIFDAEARRRKVSVSDL
jgi:hypothetical protein